MQCRHESCVCEVPSGEYCSDHCRQSAGQAGDMCNCGHPECQLNQEKRRMSPGPG